MDLLLWLMPVLLTVLWVGGTHGCMCDFPHPQNKFCAADYVVKATVVLEELDFGDGSLGLPFPLQKNYTVQYKKRDIFKGESLLGSSDTVVIRTSGTPWNCGTTFTLNKEYVISGYVSDGEFFTSQCEWNPEYVTLSSHQRRGVRYMYEQGCNCTVFHCRGDGCDLSGSSDLDPDLTCIWPGTYNKDDCYATYGFCLPDMFGVCYWKDNRKLGGCLQKEGGVIPYY
ncbi:metalloproteinase inhibitor 1-like [Crassostrea virginica]